MEATESAMQEFFSESEEILQRFSSGLSIAEKGNMNSDTIDSLYRDIHTLKGSAQLFGFQLTGQVAHAMETSLEPIRRLALKIPRNLSDSLFKAVDLIERIVKADDGKSIENKEKFDEEVKLVVPTLLEASIKQFDADLLVLDSRKLNFEEAKSAIEILNLNQRSSKREEFAQSQNTNMAQQQSTIASPSENQKNPHQIDDAKIGIKKDHPQNEQNSQVDTASTIRIQVGLLDKLMNLTGEMVLVRNQMLQYGQKHDSLEFLNLSQRLDVVTTELQGEVMKTRMQPIGAILAKFQRVIRDLARELGKQIELSIQGAETELDKTLLEGIKDPLTHIIRNCCDHGLESPEVRKKCGKDPIGQVSIRAYHEGGYVLIEIKDDGRGIDTKKVIEKALEKKLISPEQAANMHERDACYLIFAPGFSTAEKVTSVSGRGVGMDVVKTNLERIGGKVELHSEFGKGMTVRLRIPLTLAIVPALIVMANGEQFAIPQIKLAELVRVEKGGGGVQIEILQGKPVYRLRGQLISLVDLKQVLEISNEQKIEKSDSINIVILNNDGEYFGLIVDEIKDTADIVVKPLSQFLKKTNVYSGATIMGDGSVSLILDVSGIAQKANLFQKVSKKDSKSEAGKEERSRRLDEEQQDYLFFSLNSTEMYCLPLCLVSRLEEFSSKLIQYSGNQRIVKYRDSVLPLVSLNEYFSLKDPKDSESENESEKERAISLIVVQRHSRPFGIEVNEVIDILPIRGNIIDPMTETAGVWGSILVDQKVSTVVDAHGIIDSVIGIEECDGTRIPSDKVAEAHKNRSGSASAFQPQDVHILFAEDTVFFVKQVKKVLEKAGYKITHAENGDQAFQMLKSNGINEFQLILSDIEMPKLNGFELAEKVRGEAGFCKIPMIALTTKFRDADRERGSAVGFNRYLEKMRADELLIAIQDVLTEQKNG